MKELFIRFIVRVVRGRWSNFLFTFHMGNFVKIVTNLGAKVNKRAIMALNRSPEFKSLNPKPVQQSLSVPEATI